MYYTSVSQASNKDIPGQIKTSENCMPQGLAVRATQNKLGFALPGPFQNVMFVLEGCYKDCGWAAVSICGGILFL